MVNVAPDRVVRHVVGLRPFRPSGFVVKSERLGKKTVIHNYGHGGCGVTLSWGTAQLVLEEAVKTGCTQFAVVGCGAVGLATARLLQQNGFQVAIYTKDLPPNTTSNVAGAVWFPVTFSEDDRLDGGAVSQEFAEKFVRACHVSHGHFRNLVGPDYGVRWLTVYFLGRGDLNQSPRVHTLQKFAELFPDTTDLEDPQTCFGFPKAKRFRTLLIEPSI